MQPSRPIADPVIDLMARLVAQRQAEELPERAEQPLPLELTEEAAYWITPVKSDEEQTAEQVISSLVGKDNIYAISERTPGRKHIKPGDTMCFYATTKGVVAHAKVTSKPEKKLQPEVRDTEKYNWVFSLKETELYTDKPIIIDMALRSRLDEFRDRDLNKSWGCGLYRQHVE